MSWPITGETQRFCMFMVLSLLLTRRKKLVPAQNRRSCKSMALRSIRLLFHGLPRLVRIKLCHGGCEIVRGLSKVLLKCKTILIDDEGTDAGIAVLGGIGKDCNPASHLAIDDVVLRAAFSFRSLLVEHDEIISPKRPMIVGSEFVAFSRRIGGFRSERPLGLPLGPPP